MFSVFIRGLNLSDTSLKLFDIKVYEEEFTPLLVLVNRTEVPLIGCSQEHFNVNAEIADVYQDFNLSAALCPVLGS